MTSNAAPIALVLSEPWAIRPDALENLLAIANRQNEVTPEALEAYRAQHAERGQKLRIRDSIAIIDIAGPLFKRANLFQAISGASSYSVMAQDFQTALDDPAVRGIILNIDSPGGTVSGCDELASAIFAARGKKPITSVVSGTGASAAYWIATAADRVVLSDASAVGSIGVVAAIEDRAVADERRGIRTIQFVSSKAPGKRPDYDTDAGRAVIQRQVDDIETVFIAAVARHRGVSTAKVISDFGAGTMIIGANAVKLGMADAVGSFEDAFAAMQSKRSVRSATALRYAAAPSGPPFAAIDTIRSEAANIEEVLMDATDAQIRHLTDVALEATANASATIHKVGRGEASQADLALAIALRNQAKARLNALPTGRSSAAEDAAVAAAVAKIDAGNHLKKAVAKINARNTRCHPQSVDDPAMRSGAIDSFANPLMAAVATINARTARSEPGAVDRVAASFAHDDEKDVHTVNTLAMVKSENPMKSAVAKINRRNASRQPAEGFVE